MSEDLNPSSPSDGGAPDSTPAPSGGAIPPPSQPPSAHRRGEGKPRKAGGDRMRDFHRVMPSVRVQLETTPDTVRITVPEIIGEQWSGLVMWKRVRIVDPRIGRMVRRDAPFLCKAAARLRRAMHMEGLNQAELERIFTALDSVCDAADELFFNKERHASALFEINPEISRDVKVQVAYDFEIPILHAATTRWADAAVRADALTLQLNTLWMQGQMNTSQVRAEQNLLFNTVVRLKTGTATAWQALVEHYKVVFEGYRRRGALAPQQLGQEAVAGAAEILAEHGAANGAMSENSLPLSNQRQLLDAASLDLDGSVEAGALDAPAQV